LSKFEERAAQNEALFRSVNEEIERLGFGNPYSEDRLIGFICECSDSNCTANVQLSIPEYEEVRSVSRWFAVLPDHVTEAIEHVVQTHDRYVVVEKDTPTAAQIAEETNPRE
jgi:hypothetical protein